MQTKYDTNEKVWVIGTIRSAHQYNGKIYYSIDESERLVPEDICKRCTEEEKSALKEARAAYQHTFFKEGKEDSVLSYSSLQNLVLPE